MKFMKNVAIVGGGTAGWITACYLNAQLNQFENGKRIHITLIEPKVPNRIGVGEATIPTLLNTLQVLGIDEKSFMLETGATFKQGIQFVDWHQKGSHYYHVFDRRKSGVNDDAGRIWAAGSRQQSFAHTVSSQAHFCDANLSPKLLGQPDFQSPVAYAYHLDAEKFADYLSQKAKHEGVRHILGTVHEVVLSSEGAIDCLQTDDGESLKADLYIDCTGFSAQLMGKALGVETIDYSQYLLCNRAVTLQVPYEVHTPNQRRSFTTATALSNGWHWDIPLQGRRGTGYVYASEFLSDADAEAELRAFEGPHANDLPVRHIAFTSGHREKAWHRNCIAIGLSAGFLEPLESTGIFLIEFAAALLSEYFPYNQNFAPLAKRFNAQMTEKYEEIAAFLVLHYRLTQRTDTPFWQEVQKSHRIPERLKYLLELWSTKPCSFTDFHDATQVFGHLNYEYVLYGMNYQYPFSDQLAVTLAKISRREAYVQKETRMGLDKLLPHDEWLERTLGTGFTLPPKRG